jgi:predicted O-methyltransferase YrrM
MATNMNVSIRYSTFLPVLMAAMERTDGDILELGPGVFSTPYLHWMCKRQKRSLMTIENNEMWFNFVRKYYQSSRGTPHRHRFIFAKDWDDIEQYIMKPWDIVLIDHSPSERRVEEIKKLANLAKYIIIHDADDRQERNYHYSTIFPLFKYRYNFTDVEPATTVLSNLVDLSDFSV